MQISHKVLAEGRTVPWHFGFSHQSIATGYGYFYPIPLHFFVRGFRWLMYFLRFPSKDRWEQYLEEKYWEGYNDGAKVRDEHLDNLAKILKPFRGA